MFVLLPTIKQQDTYTFLIVFKERKDNPSARRRVAAEIRQLVAWLAGCLGNLNNFFFLYFRTEVKSSSRRKIENA